VVLRAVNTVVEIQVFRASTPGGAVFRAKRWFYGRFYTPAVRAGKQEIAEKNKEKWMELAAKIRDMLTGLDREKHVVRVYIAFDTKIHGYAESRRGLEKVEEFIPVAVKAEIYEVKDTKVVELISGGAKMFERTARITITEEEEEE